MKQITALVTGVLMLVTLGVSAQYPSGYGPAQTVDVVASVQAPTNTQGSTLRQRLCDPNFGRAGRLIPSWCEGTQTETSVIHTSGVPTLSLRPRPSYSNIPVQNPYVRANITFTTPRTLASVSTDTIDIMELQWTYPRTSYNRTYQEAVRMETISFQLSSNNVSEVDYTDFELVYGNEAYRLNQNGTVTLRTDSPRLASGETQEASVGVRLRPQTVLPAYNGSFRLRVTDMEFGTENTDTLVPVSMTGNPISPYFGFGVTNNFQTGSTVEIWTPRIASSTLVAEQEATLMQIAFEPQFADVYLRELTVRNTTGFDGQTLFEAVELVNENGEVVDRASFNGQEVTFILNGNSGFLPINTRTDLFVRARVQEDVPAGASVRLSFNLTDLELQSANTGLTLGGERLDVSVEENTFSVSDGTLTFAHSDVQPEFFFANGQLDTAYRFTLSNPGSEDITLARMSLRVSAFGVEWNGGDKSSGDFRLREIRSNGDLISTPFEPVDITPGVAFAAERGLLIRAGDTREFAVQVAVEAEDERTDDELIFTWLEDTTTAVGGLSELEGLGQYTIWTTDPQLEVWQSGPSVEMDNDPIVITRDR